MDSTVAAQTKGGASYCDETPPSYVYKNLRECSKYLAIRRVSRFKIIRLVNQNTLRKLSKIFRPESGEIEAVEIHYLVPSRDKVLHKLLPGVLASIDFRQSPQLGI
jgi:hypothetical protein